MATISYFDIWQTYENETITDEDLLHFAKGLFQEGFIKVSTVYDAELDKNITRYDINASKIEKHASKKANEPPIEEKSERNVSDEEIKNRKSFLRHIFVK